MLGGLAMGLSQDDVRAKMDELVDFAGLGDAMGRPMRTYSSGMRARLTFSIATLRIPEILLIDEALAVGDREMSPVEWSSLYVRQIVTLSERLVAIPPTLGRILQHYVDDIRPDLGGSEYFFINPNTYPNAYANGRRAGRFSSRSLDDLVRALSKGSGVPGRHHPHRWRHTYVTSLLRCGADLHTVQRLLGHASINTTIRYLHMVDDDLRDKVDGVLG